MTDKYKIQGWCPSFVKPAIAKDGIFLRITPDKGFLSFHESLRLCDLSIKYGNGLIDLTNRGNLQIRGIKDSYLDNFRNILEKKKRVRGNNNNIIISPFWKKNDKNSFFYKKIKDIYLLLPTISDKFSIAVDLGLNPVLSNISADIRLELSKNDDIIIRADGNKLGKKVNSENILENILLLSKFFSDNFSDKNRRMSSIIRETSLPNDWSKICPKEFQMPSMKAISKIGVYYGTKFGRINANDFKNILILSNPDKVRFTPYKTFILEKGLRVLDNNFINNLQIPENNIHACPGMFSCSASSIDTHVIANNLLKLTNKTVHVSGCNKGCAYSKNADITLVGNKGLIDVIYEGKSIDKPHLRNLSKEEVLQKVSF
jgi:precorrin-3B synthase